MAAVRYQQLALVEALMHVPRHLEGAYHVEAALHEYRRYVSNPSHVRLRNHLVLLDEEVVAAVVVGDERVGEDLKDAMLALVALERVAARARAEGRRRHRRGCAASRWGWAHHPVTSQWSAHAK